MSSEEKVVEMIKKEKILDDIRMRCKTDQDYLSYYLGEILLEIRDQLYLLAHPGYRLTPESKVEKLEEDQW